MYRTQVSDGVFLTKLPSDRFKKCRISIYMIMPGEKETATALAILPNILDRSCADIPEPLQFSRKLYKLYDADVSATSMHMGVSRVMAMSVSGIKKEFALAGEDLEAEYLDLLCKALFAPKLKDGVFSSEDVEVEKEKQAEALKSEINDKRGYCLRQARRKMFGDSQIAIESLGYLEDIEKITPQYLYECYTKLLQKAQIEIVVCGVDAEKVKSTIMAQLNKFSREPSVLNQAEPVQKKAECEKYTESMDTVQGKLCLMFSAGEKNNSKRSAIMRVASAVLGGLATSRLFTNVREKQSLCYYCASGYSPYNGTLSIDSGIEHENAEEAEKAILKELNIMQHETITDEELENAFSAIKTSFTATRESIESMEGFTIGKIVLGEEISLDKAEQEALSVKKEEIMNTLADFSLSVAYTITQKEGAK